MYTHVYILYLEYMYEHMYNIHILFVHSTCSFTHTRDIHSLTQVVVCTLYVLIVCVVPQYYLSYVVRISVVCILGVPQYYLSYHLYVLCMCYSMRTLHTHRFVSTHTTHTCRERWGAGVETQKNVRGEIGGWGRVPFNETYAPSLSTIYDGV